MLLTRNSNCTIKLGEFKINFDEKVVSDLITNLNEVDTIQYELTQIEDG